MGYKRKISDDNKRNITIDGDRSEKRVPTKNVKFGINTSDGDDGNKDIELVFGIGWQVRGPNNLSKQLN